MRRNLESSFKDCFKVQLSNHKKMLNNINNININLYQIIQKQEASQSVSKKTFKKRSTIDEGRLFKKKSKKKQAFDDFTHQVKSQVKKARKRKDESDLYANYQFY